MPDSITSWDLFVLRHRKPGNLVVHLLSLFMFWLSPLAVILTHNYWWLVGFFSSGLVGAAGHYLFKDSGVNFQEMTSSPKVVMYSSLMGLKVLAGKYPQDIRASEIKWQAYQQSLAEQKSA